MTRCVPLSSVCWVANVRDLRIAQGENQRDLAALEVGPAAMVRRPRLGLTAQDMVAAAAPTPSGGPGCWTRVRASSAGQSSGDVHLLREAARS